MAMYSNRLRPHKESSKRRSFDVNKAFEQRKINHHFLIAIIGAMLGNKILAVIYIYHLYKVKLLLEGKNKEKAGKEYSYYIRICLLRELTIITLCFRLFILVMFGIGLVNSFDNIKALYGASV